MENLQEKLPDEFLQGVYSKLLARCSYHESNAKNEKNIYRWLGYTLNVIIPVLSAIIAFLAGKNSEDTKIWLGILSLSLAILAVVNSTTKPSERYIFLANRLILLHDWKFDLDLKIHRLLQLEELESVNKIGDFLEQKNIQMSQIGLDLAKNKLPENNNNSK